jgi:hypothetical protein
LSSPHWAISSIDLWERSIYQVIQQDDDALVANNVIVSRLVREGESPLTHDAIINCRMTSKGSPITRSVRIR